MVRRLRFDLAPIEYATLRRDRKRREKGVRFLSHSDFTNDDPAEPVTEVKSSDITLESVLRNSYVDEALPAVLKNADVILLPQEGFREREDLLTFPSGTDVLFQHLKRKAPKDVTVELAVSDESYSELLLHFDLLIVPTILVTWVALPIVLDLVAQWIGQRILKGPNETEVRAAVVVRDDDGKSKELRYEGPAATFEVAMLALMNQEADDTDE